MDGLQSASRRTPKRRASRSSRSASAGWQPSRNPTRSDTARYSRMSSCSECSRRMKRSCGNAASAAISSWARKPLKSAPSASLFVSLYLFSQKGVSFYCSSPVCTVGRVNTDQGSSPSFGIGKCIAVSRSHQAACNNPVAFPNLETFSIPISS